MIRPNRPARADRVTHPAPGEAPRLRRKAARDCRRVLRELGQVRRKHVTVLKMLREMDNPPMPTVAANRDLSKIRKQIAKTREVLAKCRPLFR